MLLSLLLLLSLTQAQENLASWNDGKSKNNIVSYVTSVTDPKSPDFIPEVDRIAVFDNDGTLWSEQPVYFQFFFAVYQIKKMADEHPEWKTTQPFKAVLEDDFKTIKESGMEGIVKLLAATHAGMTTEAFAAAAKEWMATAKHPRFKKAYSEMVFQPMLELLVYLRDNGFKTYIVSGGGIDFMRAWAPDIYGIPVEQIIGSRGKVKFEMREGKGVLVKQAEVDFNDDKGGKPVGIHTHIGKRSIAAFGNSDGDLQMLQYTASGAGKRLMLYVHHTDDKREWAYDRKSHIGKFDKGLDYAKEHNWTVVDMKNDWKVVYPFEMKK